MCIRDRSNATGKHNSPSSEKEAPICLYEPCKGKGIRHYLRDCRECPEDKKKQLLGELAARRKARRSAKRASSPQVDSQDSSVQFTAEFGGRLCETLCTDIGSDENLMEMNLIERIQQVGGTVSVERLRNCLLYTSPSPRDQRGSRMPSSA